jgi:hypothetical protein
MKKGAIRYRGQSQGRELEMEFKLYKEFVQARAKGMIISRKWFLVYAQAIYRRLYPFGSYKMKRLADLNTTSLASLEPGSLALKPDIESSYGIRQNKLKSHQRTSWKRLRIG